MRNKNDFPEGAKSPKLKPAKTSVTIRLDRETVAYFKELAEKENVPYQTLINSCLADYAANKKVPSIAWREGVSKKPEAKITKEPKKPIRIIVNQNNR